ncbi:NUDIX domain-containing protein [Pedobacter sp. HDW13]|uniref:NUDIX domain-containing protein n=1 Tax=unclassified Pedobacter TaxID=2628915 RepID=UPI000F59487A|nr:MULTISPECIES: NUDIX domain-containing protein [unclassified Pedobacter]QIL41736.1 NUDIX domain-containing protein [Pedobacter sp. HDW13]RQO73484.1 NUDIX hydrolase [Pedobacter sp. KBW01]
MSYFNVRVYGLLINHNNEVLVSDEEEYGFRFSKFPGGGLELGEGLIDGLKREFVEECEAEIDVLSHFYTTDFYEKSSFNDSQVISVYYLVKEKAPLKLAFKAEIYDFDGEGEILQAFRWVKIENLAIDEITFKTDKTVAQLLKDQYSVNH